MNCTFLRIDYNFDNRYICTYRGKAMKQSLKRFFIILSFVAFIFLMQRCGEDSVNAPQDFIKGTITFKDTILRYNGGYYAVSLYSSPFTGNPVRSDSLAVVIQNGVASAYYNLTGLASATYYVGATWIRSS